MRTIEMKAVNKMRQVLADRTPGEWRIGQNDTIIGKLDGNRILHAQWKYHRTIIADILPDSAAQYGKVAVRNGGYYTATTKSRINAALSAFNTGKHIWQENFTWYYNGPLGRTVEFNEGFIA